MTRLPVLVCSALVGMAPLAAQADVSTPKLIADRPAAHCQAPRWSPDGKYLAYDVFEPKKDLRETWIVPAAGGQDGMTEVTTGRGTGVSALLDGKKPPVVELAWAPNMKLLSKPYVFSTRGPKKNFDLFADGSWLTSNPGNDGQPSWSSDGRFIAFTSQQADSGDVMVIDLAGDSQDPKRVTLWQNATEFRPVWAPGKNHLMFTRSQSGSKGQDIGLVVDVLRPKETTKMVTEWEGDEIRPSWSPDGRKVAFYANKGNANDKIFDLWVINIDGSGEKKLAKDVVVDDHLGPTWTPDGSTLLYVQKDFKNDNPVMWSRVDGSASGALDTGTQLNSDLALFDGGGELRLAFKALGQKGSTDKTWERLYVVTFTMSDLSKGESPE